jgi:hypothetical protein
VTLTLDTDNASFYNCKMNCSGTNSKEKKMFKENYLKKKSSINRFFFVPIDWIIKKKKLIDYASID